MATPTGIGALGSDTDIPDHHNDKPEPDSEVEQGDLPVRGVAWSGAAPIARVEVRIGGGPWQDAAYWANESDTAGRDGSLSPALSSLVL